MPTYEYMCQKCEHEFEREQRISDPAVKTCPKCKARRVKKLISRTSFVLKGGGWHSDLYASPKQESKSDSDAGASSSESTTESASTTESKSEKKKSSQKKASGKSSGKSAA
jgi:putative FmdB family regulatory protein